MGEALRHFPLENGLTDNSRDVIDLTAVLRVGNAEPSSVGGSTWNSRLAVDKAQAHVSHSAYPELEIKVGDKLRAVERPGEPWFEVLSINDRMQGRLIVELGEA
ncbi:hypothetical protein SAMN05421853_11013 [Roseivivax halotolerans]|uniref:Phage head-tail joining protein n=2 Tax=Roseivivax halotolerans TaxID=93684 RepID=A0A1I5ZGU2_9RHOB|nr:hypothetical protein SAMN05421853_11013 [Roseivivax halotolerans]